MAQDFDAAECLKLLRTSEGFSAVLVSPDGYLQSTEKVGHTLQRHLRGVIKVSRNPLNLKPNQYKTRFCSRADMGMALSIVMNSTQGKAALSQLTSGNRVAINTDLPPSFSINVLFSDREVTYQRASLLRAGVHYLSTVTVVDGRERAGRMHLHLHTFYPVLGPLQLAALLQRG